MNYVTTRSLNREQCLNRFISNGCVIALQDNSSKIKLPCFNHHGEPFLQGKQKIRQESTLVDL